MDIADARRRVRAAKVARLATITPSGRPHLVPCCFALGGDVAYSVVDAKPKSTLALQRVRNLTASPAVSLLVDHYEDDWSALWWVRLDGAGRLVVDVEEDASARRMLTDKYPQYGGVGMPGPVIAVDIERWTSWP